MTKIIRFPQPPAPPPAPFNPELIGTISSAAFEIEARMDVILALCKKLPASNRLLIQEQMEAMQEACERSRRAAYSIDKAIPWE